MTGPSHLAGLPARHDRLAAVRVGHEPLLAVLLLHRAGQAAVSMGIREGVLEQRSARSWDAWPACRATWQLEAVSRTSAGPLQPLLLR